MTGFTTSAFGILKPKANSTKELIKSRPYLSLSVFILIVVFVSAAGYARFQHVQAELAAQQDIRFRIQKGFDDWRDDLSMRTSGLLDGIRGTARGAGNIIGGGWGIVLFLGKAFLDFIGNLHIMIPVTVIYFGFGFFGTLKMRVATLIGALIAFLVSTNVGIVPGSVIGLFAMAGLLFWNKIDPRLLTAIQSLPTRLKNRLQQMRGASDERSPSEAEPSDEAMNSPG